MSVCVERCLQAKCTLRYQEESVSFYSNKRLVRVADFVAISVQCTKRNARVFLLPSCNSKKDLLPH